MRMAAISALLYRYWSGGVIRLRSVPVLEISDHDLDNGTKLNYHTLNRRSKPRRDLSRISAATRSGQSSI